MSGESDTTRDVEAAAGPGSTQKKSLGSKFSKAMNKIKSGTSSAGSAIIHFGKDYNKGLYGLLVALLTFGIERLLDDEVFSCPRRNADIYGLVFLIVPGLVLCLANLITVPETGKFYVWTICERCFIKKYHQRGDFWAGLVPAVCVGFVAPAVWFLLAFLNGQHFVCYKLGFQLGHNVTEEYLERQNITKNVQEFEDEVHSVKARSQYIGVLLFLGMVAVLFFVVVLKKSFVKPSDHDERLPGLHRFEKEEALAASKELKRLLLEEDRPDLSCVGDIVYCHKVLSTLEKLQEIDAKGENLTKDLEQDKKQYNLFHKVLAAWNDYHELLEKKDLEFAREDEMPEDVKAAKKKYDDEKKTLMKVQDERIAAAEKSLKETEETLTTAVDKNEALKAVKEMSATFEKLKHQKEEFTIEKAVQRWRDDEDGQIGVRVLGSKLVAQDEEGSADTRKMRGKLVAGSIIALYRKREPDCLTSEDVLKLFKNIYPRAASSHPCHRYVKAEDDLYRRIFGVYEDKLRNNEKLPTRAKMIESFLEKEALLRNTLNVRQDGHDRAPNAGLNVNDDAEGPSREAFELDTPLLEHRK